MSESAPETHGEVSEALRFSGADSLTRLNGKSLVEERTSEINRLHKVLEGANIKLTSVPERKGYRNGSYTRDLATSSGPIEELKVLRDRDGEFHTQVFERYQRYEPQVAEGLTRMFVAGVSTQKVGEVAQTLIGVAPSASTVSRLNQTLTEQFETWRERRLQERWRILYLDGVHFDIRHGDQVDSTIILTALGVDLEGNKEVLALRACAEEDKDGRSCLLSLLACCFLSLRNFRQGVLKRNEEEFPRMVFK